MQQPDRQSWPALFREILSENAVFLDENTLEAYATDETHDQHHVPDLVLKPQTTEEIAKILRCCNTRGIPVVPRGAGSGVSGGALAAQGGVVLSLERLNHILKINRRDQTVTVETGAITGEVQAAVLEHGLWLPPDPGSSEWCQIGGNLAEAAAGPKSLKYGAFRDYVLNLEVVLPSGEIMWTGADVRKFATGYNLSQLMLGSEGTLAIITKVVFRLIPPPQASLLVRLDCAEMTTACELMGKVFEAGIHPSEMEFLERDGILLAQPHCKTQPDSQTIAYVWIGFDGANQDLLLEDAAKVAEIAEQLGIHDVLVAEDEKQQRDLWQYRHQVGPAVIEMTTFRDVDLCFPRSRLLEVIQGVKAIGKAQGFRTVIFGHAGDGNLHVNVLRNQLSEEAWQKVITIGIRAIYALSCQLGGTLSGEHGIGLVLRDHLDLAFGTTHLELMRGIKRVFDPNNILNPGKMLPD